MRSIDSVVSELAKRELLLPGERFAIPDEDWQWLNIDEFSSSLDGEEAGEFSARIDSWMHELDQIFRKSGVRVEEAWMEVDASKTRSVPIAWYQPLTYYQHDAGIFLTDLGIWSIFSGLRANLSLHKAAPVQLLKAAIAILVEHELYHHRVEWYCTKINAVDAQVNTYDAYSKLVYRQNGLLEESLATARKWIYLTSKRSKKEHPMGVLLAGQSYLHQLMPKLPTGYSSGLRYLTAKAFSAGNRVLSSCISQMNAQPLSKPGAKSGFFIGAGPLEEYFSKHIVIVPWNNASKRAARPDNMHFSVPSKSVERLLLSDGFKPSALGSGSHTVWKHPDRRAVTLPQRTNIEGYQVLNNLRQSLGIGSLEELREKAKRA